MARLGRPGLPDEEKRELWQRWRAGESLSEIGRDGDRNWAINDLRDIDALSLAIPYCDVVVTDGKTWDTAVNRAHLDREFDTAIFRRMSDVANRLAG
ncbi:hypothetical protein [Streptomyces sp. NPDC055681]